MNDLSFFAVASELQICPGEWSDLLYLVQSAVNKLPSPARASIFPIKALVGMDSSWPITTFNRSFESIRLAFSDVMRERTIYVETVCNLVDGFHPLVQDDLQVNRRRMRNQIQGENDATLQRVNSFSSLTKTLTRAGSSLFAGAFLHLVDTKVQDYVYKVEELWNGCLDHFRDFHFKFFQESCLELQFWRREIKRRKAIVSDVVNIPTSL